MVVSILPICWGWCWWAWARSRVIFTLGLLARLETATFSFRSRAAPPSPKSRSKYRLRNHSYSFELNAWVETVGEHQAKLQTHRHRHALQHNSKQFSKFYILFVYSNFSPISLIKWVLLLDGMSETFGIQKLGVPVQVKGCKLILTNWSEKICLWMKFPIYFATTLSIDGGGVRGIIPILVLAALEAKL
jgi:hypothetical protein